MQVEGVKCGIEALQNQSQVDQLIIITAIRKLLATTYAQDYGKILRETSIMSVIDTILSLDSNDEYHYHMRMEALWMLTTFTSIDDVEDLRIVFLSQYGDSELIEDPELAKKDVDENRSTVLSKLNEVFMGIQFSSFEDIDMKTLEMCLIFVYNILEEEGIDFTDKLMEETCFFSSLLVMA